MIRYVYANPSPPSSPIQSVIHHSTISLSLFLLSHTIDPRTSRHDTILLVLFYFTFILFWFYFILVLFYFGFVLF